MSVKRISTYALFVCCTLMSACKDEMVGVGVHGVNYTEDELTYWIVDPNNKENRAGGEAINSYGAGGIMCCYSIPREWRPGIKVEVQAEVWLTSRPNGPDGKPKIEKKAVTVDLPKPINDQPSELWVVLDPNGKLELVAANLGPSHSDWPGKTKGMPVASKSYIKKLIRRELSDLERMSLIYQSDMRHLQSDPYGFAKEQWEFDVTKRGNTEIANAYSGWRDLRYIEHLRQKAEERMKFTEKRISDLERGLQ